MLRSCNPHTTSGLPLAPIASPVPATLFPDWCAAQEQRREAWKATRAEAAAQEAHWAMLRLREEVAPSKASAVAEEGREDWTPGRCVPRMNRIPLAESMLTHGFTLERRTQASREWESATVQTTTARDRERESEGDVLQLELEHPSCVSHNKTQEVGMTLQALNAAEDPHNTTCVAVSREALESHTTGGGESRFRWTTAATAPPQTVRDGLRLSELYWDWGIPLHLLLEPDEIHGCATETTQWTPGPPPGHSEDVCDDSLPIRPQPISGNEKKDYGFEALTAEAVTSPPSSRSSRKALEPSSEPLASTSPSPSSWPGRGESFTAAPSTSQSSSCSSPLSVKARKEAFSLGVLPTPSSSKLLQASVSLQEKVWHRAEDTVARLLELEEGEAKEKDLERSGAEATATSLHRAGVAVVKTETLEERRARLVARYSDPDIVAVLQRLGVTLGTPPTPSSSVSSGTGPRSGRTTEDLDRVQVVNGTQTFSMPHHRSHSSTATMPGPSYFREMTNEPSAQAIPPSRYDTLACDTECCGEKEREGTQPDSRSPPRTSTPLSLQSSPSTGSTSLSSCSAISLVTFDSALSQRARYIPSDMQTVLLQRGSPVVQLPPVRFSPRQR